MTYEEELIEKMEINTRRATVLMVVVIWALVALILWLPTQGVPTGIQYDHDCTDGAYVKEAHCAR